MTDSWNEIFNSSAFGGVPEMVEGGYDMARDGAGWAMDSFNGASRTTQQAVMGVLALAVAAVGMNLFAGRFKFTDPATGQETSMANTWQGTLAKLLVTGIAVFWATSDLNPMMKKSGEPEAGVPEPGNPWLDRDGDGLIDDDYERNKFGQIMPGTW